MHILPLYIQRKGMYLVRIFWVCSTILLSACSSTTDAHPSVTRKSASTPIALSSPTPTATSTPILDNGTVPPSRGTTQIVYDDKMHYLLLFGGLAHTSARDVNDTWTWNGNHWIQQHSVHSPEPRVDANLAYDSDTGQVVLFGGLDSNNPNNPNSASAEKLLNDTWIWDGSDWIQQQPTVSPPAREGAAMIYDPATKQVVLFGGGGTGPLTPSKNLPSLNDTWTWDGSNWIQQQPANTPPLRQGANIAYNAPTQNVVLYGGINFDPPQQLRDTWTWDGSDWTQSHPATSPVLSMTVNGTSANFDASSSMTYDSSTQHIMLVLSGYDVATEKQKFEAIWLWDGINWTQQSIVGPDEGFLGGRITYDIDHQKVIQFNSFLPMLPGTITHSDVFEDKLWEWNGHGWDTLEDWNK